MAKRPKHLKHKALPNLKRNNHEVTSDEDPFYNCVAFAAGVTNKKYWPVIHPDHYWPPGIPRAEEIESFVKLFESLGYTKINSKSPSNYDYIDGIEKVAIFATADGKPQHAARQIGPNKWASKLGHQWFDIEHSDNAVSDGDYGKMVVFMQRKK